MRSNKFSWNKPGATSMLIVSHLMGGLGNQMFQYAIGRRLQLTAPGREFRVYNEDRYKFANRKYTLDVFDTPIHTASIAELKRVGPERRFRRRMMLALNRPIDKHVRREAKTFTFDPDILTIQSDVYLVGFWQSFRYFEVIREQLLADFQLRQVSDVMMKSREEITSTQNSVSLHIRRTDYLNASSGFAPLGESYYRNALRLMQEKLDRLNVFVFTDDPVWAKANVGDIATKSTIHLVSGLGLQDYEELILMSHCRHNIIANSSFSWWGAWLNQNENKAVVCPRSWNGANEEIPLDDLIPPDWIVT